MVDGTVLGPPAVRTDPQEVSDLLGPLAGVQDSPVTNFTVESQQHGGTTSEDGSQTGNIWNNPAVDV